MVGEDLLAFGDLSYGVDKHQLLDVIQYNLPHLPPIEYLIHSMKSFVKTLMPNAMNFLENDWDEL